MKIYGKVEQLVHDAGNTTIYIIKGTEASLPATIDSKFVVQSDVAVLKTAFANGEILNCPPMPTSQGKASVYPPESPWFLT